MLRGLVSKAGGWGVPKGGFVRRTSGAGGLLSSPSTVVPWRLMQPVVNLEEQELEAVHGTSVESRAKSAQLLLEKKQDSFLCKLMVTRSKNNYATPLFS